MMKPNPTERTLRLECLKISANVVCQLKDPKVSVVDTAKAYFTFLNQTNDPVENEDNVPRPFRRAV